MTAFDRAFIRAYRPQDAAAQQHATPTSEAAAAMSSAAPAVATHEIEHHPAPAVIAPPTAATRNSVLAALEQPFRATFGAVRSLPTCPSLSQAMNAPAGRSMLAEASVSMEAGPSLAVAEPPAANEPSRRAMSFAAYARHHEVSERAEPPPTTCGPYRDAVAPMAVSAAVAPSPSEPVAPISLHAQPVATPDSLAALRATLQSGFEMPSTTSPFDAIHASSAAMPTAADTAAIAAETMLPSPAIQSLVEPAVAQVSSAEATFRPAWQMEQFTWPKMCRRMFARAAEELDRIAVAFIAAKQRGQTVLAVSGWNYGEGATTLLLCAARRLAERGIRIVLVDADVERPRLARRLGVQPQAGWNQSAMPLQGTSLAEVIVLATINNIALAPACEPSSGAERPTGNRSGLADCLETLRTHYDLVLVDLGPLENVLAGLGSAGENPFRGIDAVVLVRDPRLTTQEQSGEIESQLTAAGITIPGIIENFVDL